MDRSTDASGEDRAGGMRSLAKNKKNKKSYKYPFCKLMCSAEVG